MNGPMPTMSIILIAVACASVRLLSSFAIRKYACIESDRCRCAYYAKAKAMKAIPNNGADLITNMGF
jgi:hypothetical protein